MRVNAATFRDLTGKSAPSEQVVNMLTAMAASQQAAPPVVNVAAPQVTVAAPNVAVEVPARKPCGWTFKVKRDSDGLISEITATPQSNG